MREHDVNRTKDYANEILEGTYSGEGVDKWKARAEVLAKAFLRLAAEGIQPDDARVEPFQETSPE